MGEVVGAPMKKAHPPPALWSSVEGPSALVSCLPAAPTPSTAFGPSHASSAQLELKARASPGSGYTSDVKQIPSPTCGLKIDH